MAEKPYWFPTLVDKPYFDQLRKDYPDNAHMSDEELHEYYANGAKYSTTWDHIGDAYEDFEPLADAFLTLLDACKAALDVGEIKFKSNPLASNVGEMLKAAIAKAEDSE